MSKPKTTKPSAPSAPSKPAEILIAAPDEITPTTLSSDDWAFLEKVSTFLFHIQAYAARAKVHGYDDAENENLKALLEKASGRDRPLSHWIVEGAYAGITGQFTAEQMRLLQEIDGFENTWFPRVRAILQRAIPEDRHEVFAGAFFKDLSQQPLGPGVLDSVPTLLARFEALQHSKEPGAKEAHELGTKRGLTKAKIAQVQAVIEAAKNAMPDAAPTSLSPAQLAAAKQEQLAALRKLRRVFNDWATTFRDVFGLRILIRLGLATLKRSAKNDPEEGEEPENDTTTSEDAEAKNATGGDARATPAKASAAGKGGK